MNAARANTQTGFTIIEVTLVLAISSLLLILVMTGITLAVQRQRFSDSVNGTQSFLQQQFNYTQNTVNDRLAGSCGNPNQPGDPVVPDLSERGASGCLVIGKLLEIEPASGAQESTISSYDVIATDVDINVAPYKDDADIDLIRAINPTAIKQTSLDSVYNVPWGAQIRDSNDANATASGSPTPVRFVALLRSPSSGIIHVYRLNGVTPFTTPTKSLSADIQDIANDSVKMCINSIDLIGSKAMLEIIPLGSQDGIVTHFDDTARMQYPCS